MRLGVAQHLSVNEDNNSSYPPPFHVIVTQMGWHSGCDGVLRAQALCHIHLMLCWLAGEVELSNSSSRSQQLAFRSQTSCVRGNTKLLIFPEYQVAWTTGMGEIMIFMVKETHRILWNAQVHEL